MRKVLLILTFTTLVMFIGAAAFASVSDDQVTSQKIKEADGTSGQNTNSGSGVKTGHIQDGAVTDEKIAGPITASKISSTGLNADTVDGKHATDLAAAVHTHDGSDIIDGSLSSVKIADGAVSTSKIANGAVTDAKIAGPISASKISSSGLNADMLDGFHASDLAPTTHVHDADAIVNGTLPVERLGTYKNVRIVHKGAVDGVNTFGSVSDALASITDNSADNPYTVLIMPGIYTESFTTKDYVAIRGSGKEVTKISSAVSAGWAGTVTVSGATSIEGVTIENVNSDFAVAVLNGGGSPIIDSAIIARGNTAYGMVLGCTPFVVKRTEIAAIGASNAYGMQTISYCTPVPPGKAILEHSKAYAESSSDALAVHINNAMDVDIVDSSVSINGPGLALRVFGRGTVVRSFNSSFTDGAIGVWSEGTFLGVNSMITSGFSNGWGLITVKMLNCYDGDLNPI